MSEEPQRIGETLTTQLLAGEGPTVKAFRACCRIRAFCREAGISREDEEEGVRAVWIQHNLDEATEPQQQWADTILENLRSKYREHQRSLSAQSGGDPAETDPDQA